MSIKNDASPQSQLQVIEEVFAPLITKNKIEKGSAENISQMAAAELDSAEVGHKKGKKSENTEQLKNQKLRPSQDVANETQRVINQGVEKSPELFLEWFENAAPLLMDGIVNNTSIEEFEAFEAEFMPTMESVYSSVGKEYNSPKIADRGIKEAPSIFTQWTSDALTLFMFDNAPLLQILNFMLKQSLTKAQTSLAEAQMSNAETAKKLTIEKGESEAQKCTDQAVSSFVSGGMGLAQTGASFKDNMISQDTFQKDLAHTDNTLELMKEGRASAAKDPNAAGSISPPDGNLPKMSAEDKLKVDELAEAFKKDYHETLDKEMDPSSSPLLFEKGHKSFAGLNQNEALVMETRAVAASAKSSTKAMENLKNTLSKDPEFAEKFCKNPEYSGAFFTKLSALNQNNPKVLDRMMSGNSPKVQLGNSGGNYDMKNEMFRSFGKSDTRPNGDPTQPTTADSFISYSERARDVKAGKAQQEYSKIENDRVKRQLMAQTIQGFADGSTQIDAAEQSKNIAEDEAGARMSEVIASNCASAREALAAAISGASDRIQSFDSWFTQMQQQLAGALSQSFA